MTVIALQWNPEVKIGDVLTGIALAFTATALFFTGYQVRQGRLANRQQFLFTTIDRYFRDPVARAFYYRLDCTEQSFSWKFNPDSFPGSPEEVSLDYLLRTFCLIEQMLKTGVLSQFDVKVLGFEVLRVMENKEDHHLPRAISRFLASTLRANQYKTRLYRGEITQIMLAFDEAGLTAAALNGIAAESSLYGGAGARQFSDLDLLLAPEDITLARTVLSDLGYHSGSPEATTYTRHVDDILVPRITLDLTQPMLHARDEHGVREILNRRCWQPLPGHDLLLPVLAAPDALLHCLTRLEPTTHTPPQTGAPRWALCADALRLHRACENLSTAHRNPATVVPARATAGWMRLRQLWPQLPPTPFSPGTDR